MRRKRAEGKGEDLLNCDSEFGPESLKIISSNHMTKEFSYS